MHAFKEYNQDQPFLLPLSLYDFLPDGHLAKVINDIVNELDLRELYAKYSDIGCSAYHPQMMLKVLTESGFSSYENLEYLE